MMFSPNVPKIHTHGIHVWYIYLHLVEFVLVNVGRYTIHGSYGTPFPSRDLETLRGIFFHVVFHTLEIHFLDLKDEQKKIPKCKTQDKLI